MDTTTAEAMLNDLLMNGVAKEIFMADQTRALAETIGTHSPIINEKGFGALFGSLQNILSDQQTLAAAKIYDPPQKRYSIRSIPAVLLFIETHSDLWSLPERFVLEELLVYEGVYNSPTTSRMSNQELSLAVVSSFAKTIPRIEKAHYCSLSSALKSIREARDKVHAHNEAIDKAVRRLPTWGEVELLINYAKEFMCTVGRGFLGIHFGNRSDDYLLASDARRISRTLDKVILRAVSASF